MRPTFIRSPAELRRSGGGSGDQSLKPQVSSCSETPIFSDMKIGLSTSVIQRGQTGVAQYVFALLRGLLARADGHQFTVFVLEDDLPHFEFARGHCRLVAVPERFRSPVKDILWHQTML